MTENRQEELARYIKNAEKRIVYWHERYVQIVESLVGCRSKRKIHKAVRKAMDCLENKAEDEAFKIELQESLEKEA